MGAQVEIIAEPLTRHLVVERRTDPLGEPYISIRWQFSHEGEWQDSVHPGLALSPGMARRVAASLLDLANEKTRV